MKRTLRVLFLAVLAMALMASGAFAVAKPTAASFDVSFDVDATSITTGKAVTSGEAFSVDVNSVKSNVIVVFKFKTTVVSASSYDFAYSVTPNTLTTSMYRITSADGTKANKTMVSGDAKLTISVDVTAAKALIKAPATSVDLTFTIDVTSSSKNGSGSVAKFPIVIKLVSADTKGGGEDDEGTPGMSFYEDGSLSDLSFTYSADAKAWYASMDVDFAVSSDLSADIDETTEVVFTYEDDPDNMEFTSELTNKEDDGDNVHYTYTLTFTATDSTDEGDWTVAEIALDDVVSFEPESATFNASFSGESSTTDATATINVSEDNKIYYFEKKDITIKVSPYRTAGYTIKTTFTNNSGGSLTSTDMVQGAIHVSATNNKTYTYTAGGKTAKDTIVFTVSSGDTTIDTFTVNFNVAMNEENPATPTKPKLAGLTDLPADYQALFGRVKGVTFYEDLEKLEDAFESGKGIVAWAMKAAGPVKIRKRADTSGGWILYFLGAKSNKRPSIYVKQYKDVLLEIWGTSGVSIAAETTSNDCIIDPVSGDIAIYQVNIDNTAAGLESGDKFGVNCSYNLEEYEDEGINKPATPEVVGSIAGTMPTGGSSGVLGGSSGGCDAGFGAVALALAATLFLGKKRS